MSINNLSILNDLKTSLAIRKTNFKSSFSISREHAPLLFHLMINDCESYYADVDSTSITIKDNRLVFNLPNNATLFAVRSALDKFFDGVSYNQEINDDNLINLDFLKQSPQTTEIVELIKALEISEEVIRSIDRKNSAENEISSFFEKEIKILKEAFLKKTNLNLTYSCEQFPHFELKKYPNWLSKYELLDKNRCEAVKLLLTKDDYENLNKLLLFPDHIFVLCAKKIGLIRIITYWLDELAPFKSKMSKVESLLSLSE